MFETAHPPLDSVPVVLAALRSGSATAAARRLGLGTATVLRRIETLEAALDVALFHRTPTGLQPTDALPALLPWLERIEAASLELRRSAQAVEREVAGTVRFAVLPTLSSRLLVPQLGALRARHPGLRLELLASDGLVDLSQLEADLALRVVRPTHTHLVARRVLTFRYRPYLSAALRSTLPHDDLASLPWLTWSHLAPPGPDVLWMRAHVPDDAVVLRASDMESLVEAAAGGLGVALLPEAVAATAALVPWDGPTPDLPTGDLWLAAHEQARRIPRVAAVWDWVVGVLAPTEAPRDP